LPAASISVAAIMPEGISSGKTLASATIMPSARNQRIFRKAEWSFYRG
jgi:hypothetical protein